MFHFVSSAIFCFICFILFHLLHFVSYVLLYFSGAGERCVAADKDDCSFVFTFRTNNVTEEVELLVQKERSKFRAITFWSSMCFDRNLNNTLNLFSSKSFI